MNWTKVRHATLITLGLLSSFAGVVYQGQLAGNEVGPGMTFATLAGIVIVMWGRYQAVFGKATRQELATIAKIFHFVSCAAAVGMPLLVLFQSRFAPGSQAFIVSGYLSTFVGDLARVAGTTGAAGAPADKADSKKVTTISGGPLALLVLIVVLMESTVASAAEDPVPNDVAPPLSFCVGRTYHCMFPDMNLSAVNYDLSAKKWQTGVKTIAIGYEFIFYSDKPWGFGPAVHGTGQWGQADSFLAITTTAVLLRYFEVGATFVLLDGKVDKFLTFGIAADADILTRLLTGMSMPARLEQLRRTRQNEYQVERWE